MNCDLVLERMLAADLNHRAFEADPALARHLDGCVRCRSVVSALRSDTTALATAVAARRAVPVGGSTRRAWGAGLAPRFAAAAVALSVGLGWWFTTDKEPAADEFVVAPAVVRDVAPWASTELAMTGVPLTGTGAPSRRASKPRGVRIAPAIGTEDFDAVPLLGREIGQEVKAFVVAGVSVTSVRSVPVMALAFDPVNFADSSRSPEITVTPASGTRALVARTSDPRITVIWLY